MTKRCTFKRQPGKQRVWPNWQQRLRMAAAYQDRRFAAGFLLRRMPSFKPRLHLLQDGRTVTVVTGL